MKSIDYDHWFSLEFWTFEQAAYLFNKINPSDEDHIINLNDRSSKMIGGKGFDSIDAFKKSLQLLKGTYFPCDKDFRIPDDSVALTSIFKFAEEKKIGLHSSSLLSKWESRLKHTTPLVMNTSLTNKMQETLQPIIILIDEFAKNSDFIRHGKKTPQNLITSWLAEKKLPKHQQRHIKELITSFYSIETSRIK